MSLASLGYFTLWLSISNVPTVLIAIIASIIVIKYNHKIKNFNLLFFIIGILTTYFCWMNFTLITLGFPLILYFLQKEDWKNSIKSLFSIAVFYFLGYGLTWVMKWILTDLFFQTNSIIDGIKQVLHRSGDSYNNNKITIFKTIISNIVRYLPWIELLKIYICTDLIIKGIKLCKSNNLEKNTDINLKEMFVYLCIAILPFFIYLVTLNHSYVHANIYTYRMLALTLTCILIIHQKFWNCFKIL